ncbi:MAG: hypothetical protein U1A77_23180 [Pirellulales bacterium]
MSSSSRLVWTVVVMFLTAFTEVHARTWTDRNGRTVEGDIVEIKEDHVIIRRNSDDKQFRVLLANLSDSDREFIREQQAATRTVTDKSKKPSTSWDSVNVARLSVPIGSVLKPESAINMAAELDEKMFPEKSFDARLAEKHFRSALLFVEKPDMRAARMRAVSETSFSLTLSAEFELFVFKDSEESWPKDGQAKVRFRGVRAPSASMPKILETAVGMKAPRVEDGFLEVAIKRTLKDIADEKPVAYYDLVLECTNWNSDGSITGTLSGRLGDGIGEDNVNGSKVKDVLFRLEMYNESGKRLP